MLTEEETGSTFLLGNRSRVVAKDLPTPADDSPSHRHSPLTPPRQRHSAASLHADAAPARSHTRTFHQPRWNERRFAPPYAIQAVSDDATRPESGSHAEPSHQHFLIER